jgi:flavin reductase (DIM6/NTAB) family NADH-FMN oxidoreductase RutF
MTAVPFAQAMSELASGVVLVTCSVGGRPWGTTVTAFASVSAEPPTVLVSLRSGTRGVRAIRATGRFGVSILSAEQVGVARRGAEPGLPKFLDALAAAAALAHLQCEVSGEVAVADHTVFFGRVGAATTGAGRPPLLYHRRAYRTLAAGAVEAICLAS